MTSNNREAVAILTELGVEIVAKNVAPRPGQTRSVGTVQKIIRRHGVEHARLVLSILTESENCKGYLSETVIGAVSDMVLVIERGYPDIYKRHMDRVYAFFDQTPIGAIEYLYARNLAGITNRRSALVGLLNERIIRTFGDPQLDLLDDRKMSA